MIFETLNNEDMDDLFGLLTLGLSISTAIVSYYAYTIKKGALNNISVYIMIAAVVTAVAQLIGLSGVLPEGSVVGDILDKSEIVCSVMLLLIILEVQNLKK